MNVGSVAEKYIQGSTDATAQIHLNSFVSVFDHPMIGGQADFGIVLSLSVEGALLDWIPINNRFCAVRLDGSVCVGSNRLKRRCLFVVCVNASIDSSSPEAEDQFFPKLPQSPLSVRSTDVVVVAVVFNALPGYLVVTKLRIRSRFSDSNDLTNDENNLIQICSDYRLFLVKATF